MSAEKPNDSQPVSIYRSRYRQPVPEFIRASGKAAEYEDLLSELEAEHCPQDLSEQMFLERAAMAIWHSARVTEQERAVYEKNLPPEKELAEVDRLMRRADLFFRSFVSNLRGLKNQRRHRREMQEHRAASAKSTPPPTAPAPSATRPIASKTPKKLAPSDDSMPRWIM
jgi:hypothetical protein